MYDTARRVALVKQRVRENTCRRQRRGIYGLSAACMLLLFTVLMQAAGTVIGPGQTAAWGSFGAMLLREDAGGYGLAAGAGTLQKRRMQTQNEFIAKAILFYCGYLQSEYAGDFLPKILGETLEAILSMFGDRIGKLLLKQAVEQKRLQSYSCIRHRY